MSLVLSDCASDALSSFCFPFCFACAVVSMRCCLVRPAAACRCTHGLLTSVDLLQALELTPQPCRPAICMTHTYHDPSHTLASQESTMALLSARLPMAQTTVPPITA